MRKRKESWSLREAGYGPVQLGDTKGRMVAVPNEADASLGDAAFLYVKDGLLCVIPWKEAIERFGPPKTDT
jgi:hypothetical protein